MLRTENMLNSLLRSERQLFTYHNLWSAHPTPWPVSCSSAYRRSGIKLSRDQLERYKKQLSLPGVEELHQVRLLTGTALIVGGVGTGAIVAEYLHGCGVGTITVADKDSQVIDRLRQSSQLAVNPDSSVYPKIWSGGSTQIEEWINEHEVVVDGLDDWQDKLLLSDLCMNIGRPLVHAGVIGFRLQCYTMLPGTSSCLRCALPKVGIDDVPLEPPEHFSAQMILGIAGALQGLEAMKVVAHLGVTQGNELIKLDGLSGEFEIFRGLDKVKDCPDCGRSRK